MTDACPSWPTLLAWLENDLPDEESQWTNRIADSAPRSTAYRLEEHTRAWRSENRPRKREPSLATTYRWRRRIDRLRAGESRVDRDGPVEPLPFEPRYSPRSPDVLSSR